MEDGEEGQLSSLVSTLDLAHTAEKRVAALQTIQEYLSGQDEITNADQLTASFKAQLKNQNHLVSSLAIAILPLYVSRLVTSPIASRAHDVKTILSAALPLVLDRLSDHKEKIKETAKNAILEMAKAAFAVSGSTPASIRDTNSAVNLFERLYRDAGLAAKAAKVKEQSTLLLLSIRNSVDRLQLKPFLPLLVEQLSDADAAVREAARTACINLFTSASITAKSELKKEMEKKNVRKQTADAILAQILGGSADLSLGPSSESRDTAVGVTKEVEISSNVVTTPARTDTLVDDGISAIYVASAWDLETTMQAMLPHFEGKETEHNWLAREQSIIKLRGMLKTGVYTSLYDGFLQGLRLLLEGILKATASLRTTLSMHALQLISELAKKMREGMDAIAEALLTSIIKMAGFTKRIVATASQVAVRDIIVNTSYRHKFLDLIWQHLQEKTVTTRAFMCDHLIAILNTHAIHRINLVEAHGGLDLIDRFCKKALTDQNKDVREKAREAFYAVENIWPALATQITATLDAATRKQIESNRGMMPSWNASMGTQTIAARVNTPAAVRVAPPLTSRRAGGGPGPSSAIVAAKRAAAARLAQERRNQEEAEMATPLADEQEEESQASLVTSGTDLERERMEGVHAKEATNSQSIMDEEEEKRDFRNETANLTRRAPISFPSLPSPKSPLRSSHAPSNGRSNKGSMSPSLTPLSLSPRSAADRNASHQQSHFKQEGSSSSFETSANSVGASAPARRARHESTSSTSSARSSGRLGSASGNSASSTRYESFGQRVGQNGGTITRSRNSSTSSIPAQQIQSSPSLARARGLSTSSPSQGFNRSSQNGQGDETLLLEKLPDASTDLLLNSADYESANSSSFVDQTNKKRQSLSSQLSALSTSSPPHFDQSIKETPVSPSKGSSSSSGRSRLPRPVNMSNSSQSRSSLRTANGESDKVKPTVVTRSTVASDQTIAEPDAALSKDQPLAERKTITSTSAAVKWFLGKASRLDRANEADVDQLVIQLSPVKKRPESEIYINQLQAGEADVRTFKGLAKLCKDYRLPDCDQDDMEDGDDEPMLQAGQYETVRSALEVTQSRREQDIAVTMWQQGNLFERLYEAISFYLCNEGMSKGNKDLQTAALIVLHRLVENQFRLFEVQHKERDLLELLFELIKKNKASSVKSACQAIMESWSEQTNVVVGISTIRGILSIYLGDMADANSSTSATSEKSTSSSSSIISIHTLTLRSLARLFQRLPIEVVEEEVIRCKMILIKGLNHWNIETRQQAVSVLVAANGKVNDPKRLFTILQPMEKSQEDLLMYYMSKS